MSFQANFCNDSLPSYIESRAIYNTEESNAFLFYFRQLIAVTRSYPSTVLSNVNFLIGYISSRWPSLGSCSNGIKGWAREGLTGQWWLQMQFVRTLVDISPLKAWMPASTSSDQKRCRQNWLVLRVVNICCDKNIFT